MFERRKEWRYKIENHRSWASATPINNFLAFAVGFPAGESVVSTDRRVIKFLMDFMWLTAHRKLNFKVKLEVCSDNSLLWYVM